MNIARADSSVDYLNTGVWSKKALARPAPDRKVNIVADGGGVEIHHRAGADALRLSAHAAYVHYTPNETIAG